MALVFHILILCVVISNICSQKFSFLFLKEPFYYMETNLIMTITTTTTIIIIIIIIITLLLNAKFLMIVTLILNTLGV